MLPNLSCSDANTVHIFSTALICFVHFLEYYPLALFSCLHSQSSDCILLVFLQLDRFASIRIPGSKKERPPPSHFKHSSSDWSISSSSSSSIPLNCFDELSSKITSEKEILALFEKMMVCIYCAVATRFANPSAQC